MKKHVVKLQYNAPVVLSFALISLAVLGLDALTGGWSTVKLFSVYRSSPSDLLTYPRSSCTSWGTAITRIISAT